MKYIFSSLFLILFSLTLWTCINLEPIPSSLEVSTDTFDRLQFLDRNGEELSRTYQTKWNVTSQVELNTLPKFLTKIFVAVEDKRFYSHHGTDWFARLSALIQLIKRGHAVRGASTITEQVVKLLHKRKRSIRTKWFEGWEAVLLERRFTKDEILEFYLNQVPYARNIRGIKAAAKFYFNRSLNTLSKREMTALAVLLRSPSRFDPAKDKQKLEKSVNRSVKVLREKGIISKDEYQDIIGDSLEITSGKLEIDAPHFLSYLRQHVNLSKIDVKNGYVRTSIDGYLQTFSKQVLDSQIERLKDKKVKNGAILVLDLHNNEVLVWAVAGDYNNDDGGQIDGVTILRQPGSTLKPFLYALALEKGWNAATIIDDAPLSEAVNQGVHDYRNFSGIYYGPLRLRYALANSLNTPAVRTINYVTDVNFLHLLNGLHFKSLNENAHFYGGGLALGNGEVTLLELVRAYAVLARSGVYKNLNFIHGIEEKEGEEQIFHSEDADIISDILADREARAMEFGKSVIYQFNNKVALKTGTSSDFRDAWAVAYSGRYVVGSWMGNYNRDSMDKVSGSIGPMAVVKTVFSELHDNEDIHTDENIEHHAICAVTGLLAGENCPAVDEIFAPTNVPKQICNGNHKKEEKLSTNLNIVYPIKDMTLAIDLRIPLDKQHIFFELQPLKNLETIHWYLDKEEVGQSRERNGRLSWQITKGQHRVQAVVFKDGKARYSQEIKFRVK